jgi:hypothetical protein
VPSSGSSWLSFVKLQIYHFPQLASSSIQAFFVVGPSGLRALSQNYESQDCGTTPDNLITLCFVQKSDTWNYMNINAVLEQFKNFHFVVYFNLL